MSAEFHAKVFNGAVFFEGLQIAEQEGLTPEQQRVRHIYHMLFIHEPLFGYVPSDRHLAQLSGVLYEFNVLTDVMRDTVERTNVVVLPRHETKDAIVHAKDLDIVVLEPESEQPMYLVTPSGWWGTNTRVIPEESKPGHIVLARVYYEFPPPLQGEVMILKHTAEHPSTFSLQYAEGISGSKQGEQTQPRLALISPEGEINRIDTALPGEFPVFFCGILPVSVSTSDGLNKVSGFVMSEL